MNSPSHDSKREAVIAQPPAYSRAKARDALAPWLVGAAIIATAFILGAALDWSDRAIGSLAVLGCLAAAVTRALMHDCSTGEWPMLRLLTPCLVVAFLIACAAGIGYGAGALSVAAVYGLGFATTLIAGAGYVRLGGRPAPRPLTADLMPARSARER